jgi:hypothetical protein
MATHTARLRRKAGRAIRRELEAREVIGHNFRLRLELVETKPASIEYKERS